jgi:mannose-6-phosphate isomerase-like protein (cupin superfamily)
VTQTLLQLHSDRQSLGVPESVWRSRLKEAQSDFSVGILHAALTGDSNYRLHVASIPSQVGCHFHAIGNEDYAVVSGAGTLHWGKVGKTNDEYQVTWEQPVAVETGDRFIIPEGYAHQLRSRGEENLVIIFGCPDSHLDDTQDRSLLPDAPLS